MELIDPGGLPKPFRSSFNEAQRNGLAFARRAFVVAGDPRIQTIQIGSSTRGAGITRQVGLARSLSTNWAAFGSVGGITLNQQTANQFRTDIQLRLEDAQNGEKVFLDQTVPMAVTASIERGDKLEVYYLKGGMPTPVAGDFRANEWTPFAANNLHTNQIIPLSPVPPFITQRPSEGRWTIFFGILLLITGVLILILNVLTTNANGVGAGIAFVVPGGIVLFPEIGRRRRLSSAWKRDISRALEERAAIYRENVTKEP